VAEGGARQALIEAAIRLMEDRPPSAVSGRELAEEAGVNYGLIHYYFGGKQEAFRAARRHFTRSLIENEMAGGTRPVSADTTSEDRRVWAVAGHMALEPVEVWGEEYQSGVVAAYLRLCAEADPDGDPVYHATVIAALYALQLGWPIFGEGNAHIVGLADDQVPAVRARVHGLVDALHRSVGIDAPGDGS